MNCLQVHFHAVLVLAYIVPPKCIYTCLASVILPCMLLPCMFFRALQAKEPLQHPERIFCFFCNQELLVWRKSFFKWWISGAKFLWSLPRWSVSFQQRSSSVFNTRVCDRMSSHVISPYLILFFLGLNVFYGLCFTAMCWLCRMSCQIFLYASSVFHLGIICCLAWSTRHFITIWRPMDIIRL